MVIMHAFSLKLELQYVVKLKFWILDALLSGGVYS